MLYSVGDQPHSRGSGVENSRRVFYGWGKLHLISTEFTHIRLILYYQYLVQPIYDVD
jgi:hypothetical protein